MSAAERVPGDPAYVRKLWRGELAMPALTTARARWDARQAEICADSHLRSRMLLAMLDQFLDEVSEEFAATVTLRDLKKLLERFADGEIGQ